MKRIGIILALLVPQLLASKFHKENNFFISDNGWCIPYKERVVFSANAIDLETENFIRLHPEWFGDISSLSLGKPVEHRYGNHIFLRRELLYNRTKIWERDFEFRLIEDGNFYELWGLRGRFKPAPFRSALRISEAELKEILGSFFTGKIDSLESAELLYYYYEGIYRLSYLAFYRASLTERYAVFVDAGSGEILHYVNTVMYHYDVSGYVGIHYYPQRPSDGYHEAPFKNGHLSVNFLYTATTDTFGNYIVHDPSNAPGQEIRARLNGEYVYVEYIPGAPASYVAPVNPPCIHNWVWTEALAHPDELNLYYHTDFVHAWYKALDPSFTAMDYSVPARAQVREMTDNAFWDGWGTNYGAIGPNGFCKNFALFSDVVYHEYSHGVTQYMYNGAHLPYEGQSGAMNEAWSDYFACTINNDPLHGEGICGGPFRNLINNLRFPDDTTGEVHHDSAILSGALWGVREHIPHHTADSLAHFSRYGHANNFFDYFLDYLYTDDSDGNLSTGTPHFNVIFNSFADHGIGPGYYPQIVLTRWSFNDSSWGNGNMIAEPGETLSLRFSVLHKGDFPYPTARDVEISLRSLDPTLAIALNTAELGDLDAGDSATSGPIRLAINNYTFPCYAYLALEISATNAERSLHDTLRLPLGRTRLLVVDDDGGEKIEKYYTHALDYLQCLYDIWDIDSLGSPSDSVLQKYDVLIWFTGNETNPINSEDMLLLSRYLDDGKCLILTGQNIGESIQGSSFMRDYIRAVHTADRVSNYILEGVPGSPVTDSVRIAIVGSPGAGNQTSPSSVEALDGGRVILRYLPRGIGAATLYENGYRAFYFAFGLEAISGSATFISLERFLYRLLTYAGIETNIEREKISPLSFYVSEPYPNPFNSNLKLLIKTPYPVQANISVLDIMGRKVADLYEGLFYGEKLIEWMPQGHPSGLYFIRVSGKNFEHIRKAFLLK